MTVEASIVVRFGEGVTDSAFLVAELDDERNVAPDGSAKSRFLPGDEVFFLTHHSWDLVIASVTCTAGQVERQAEVLRPRVERQLFTGYDDKVALRYRPAGLAVPVWYGRQGFGLRQDGQRLAVAGGVPCLADFSYEVQFTAWRYIPPALDLDVEEEFPVAIVIYAEAG